MINSTNRLIHVVCAAFSLFASWAVYLMTVSPTVAFWDCGEYLAATQSLGIPHPPGTPLLILLGRVWQIVFFFIADPGRRYNLLAATGSAIVIVFVYLIAAKTLIAFAGVPRTAMQRVAVFGGSVCAALLCAFGDVYWACSIEMSEQSNVPLLPAIITVWLALVWAESGRKNRDRILLLIAYVAFAGAGMHMISMIALPAVFLFVMMNDRLKRADWRLWGCAAALATAMYHLSWFLFAAGAILIITGVLFWLDRKHAPTWSLCFFLAAFSLLGFSNHLYLPVRSSLNPAIDESHPVTWEAFIADANRDQYIRGSMVARSLWRRGSLSRQFGIAERIGYGGFHITQFFHFNSDDAKRNFLSAETPRTVLKLIVYLLPTLLALYGWPRLFRRKASYAVLIAVATFVATIALAWYMNFADGSRPEYGDYKAWLDAGKPGPMPIVHGEVRLRDYFFNAGFMFFALSVGLGAGILLSKTSESRRRFIRKGAAPALAVLLCAAPALPLSQNYAGRDRHCHTLPFDYAKNMLRSCEQNAILFAGGDNTTFPLWALQEAYGFRRDVRVVNLSLLNTQWYLKQLRDREPRLALPYSDCDLAALRNERNSFTVGATARLPHAAMTVLLPDKREKPLILIQDKAILNIVDANARQKPVYFAANVADGECFGLFPFLRQQGLVKRLLPEKVPPDCRIDGERSESLIGHVYAFRNLSGPGVARDEASSAIEANYAALFTAAAWSLMNCAGNQTEDSIAHSSRIKNAHTLIDRCCQLFPGDRQAKEIRRTLFPDSSS